MYLKKVNELLSKGYVYKMFIEILFYLMLKYSY